MSRVRLFVLLLAFVGASSTPQRSRAQDATRKPDMTLARGEVNPDAARLIDEVMSPFCPGLILTNCPTLAADSLRRAIRERFKAGATREQVMRELSTTYGDVIKSAPEQSGFGLLAWLVPGLAVFVAGLFVTAFVRRRRPPEPPPPSAPASADAASPLDAELAARLRDG